MKIAIIGAGLSGLYIAQKLNNVFEIQVFEKARGVSGRLSTRYTENFQFDHGAQYFTARDVRFKNFLKPYIETGIVEEWKAKVICLEKGKKAFKKDWFEPHYISSPKMNQLCKELAKNSKIELQTRIVAIRNENKKWNLVSDDHIEFPGFDLVISTAPAPQSLDLLRDHGVFSEALEGVEMSPCHSLMIGLSKSLDLNFDCAFVNNSPISWIARNHLKPTRATKDSLVIQTDAQWSQNNIENDSSSLENLLTNELSELIELDPNTIEYKNIHRWKYSRVEKPLGRAFLLSNELNLACSGDWCLGGRVESAFLSSHLLAEELLDLKTGT